MFTGLLAENTTICMWKAGRFVTKQRSPRASLLFKGQGTGHTTVKWPIQDNTKSFSRATQKLPMHLKFYQVKNKIFCSPLLLAGV